jgi:hypothetical protein
MFSPLLNAFRTTNSGRPNAHPERHGGSASSDPSPTAASLHISHSLPAFSKAPTLRAHSHGRNFNPFMTLLHDPLDTPGGESDIGTGPSLNSNHDAVSPVVRGLSSALERPLPNIEKPVIIAIPFRITTYAKRTRNPFRIRAYKKTGGGGPLNDISIRLFWRSIESTHSSILGLTP